MVWSGIKAASGPDHGGPWGWAGGQDRERAPNGASVRHANLRVGPETGGHEIRHLGYHQGRNKQRAGMSPEKVQARSMVRRLVFLPDRVILAIEMTSLMVVARQQRQRTPPQLVCTCFSAVTTFEKRSG